MKRIAVIPAAVAVGIVFTPLAQADDTPATPGLTDAVRQLYTQVQTQCTPTMPPHFLGIQLGDNLTGRIIDADPRLGGPFEYAWAKDMIGVPSASYRRVGNWFINLDFC